MRADNELGQPRSFGDEILRAAYEFFAWGGSLPSHTCLCRLDEMRHALETRSNWVASRQRGRV